MIALLLALLTMLSGGAVDHTFATGIRTERSAAGITKVAPRPVPTPAAARPLAG